MIRAIAVDDEPPALRVLTHFCSQVDFIQLEKTFTRTDEALTHLRSFPTDLLFLDIHMPAMSGLDFYRVVPQEAMVIFTTAYAEYAVEGFNLNAVDYLLKPFTRERFLQAVHKANEYHTFLHQTGTPRSAHLFVRADYRLHKIALADILLIEALDDYLKIHLPNARLVVTRMTMKAVLEMLPETDFVRVHRSYIVPLSHIRHVRNKVISLAGMEVPIGASYEEAFFRRYGS